jgi:WD40 repeat protein
VQEGLLCTLSTHERSVNVVRWSKDGSMLASGSDDCCVLVYRYTPAGMSSQSFGSQKIKNKETWTRCYTMKGHTMDVLDLDWSPRGMLASASIDNQIMVWPVNVSINGNISNKNASNVGGIQTPYKILSGHQSFVKGVSFDPVGRFLISCGTDNKVILWDCNSWTEIKQLDDPLKNSPDRTIFRRMSWAPDGGAVCLTSAIKSAKPVGMVLKRGTWESVADLVGHNGPSVSCRFCPSVLVNKGKTNGRKDSTGQPACCVAIGDQLGVVSIWTTSKDKPLFVLRDAFDSDVTDVAWMITENKSVVLSCCSLDGNIVFLDFGSEIGSPMEDAALDKHFQSLYGRGHKEMHNELESLVEDPIALKYMKNNGILMASKPEVSTPSKSRIEGIVQNPPPIINVLSTQVQTKTKDGKKRITPVLMQQPSQNFSSIGNAPPNGTASSSGVAAPPNISSVSMVNSSLLEKPVENHFNTDNDEFGSDTLDSHTVNAVNQIIPNKVLNNDSFIDPTRKNIDEIVGSSQVSKTLSGNKRSLVRSNSNNSNNNNNNSNKSICISFNREDIICSAPLSALGADVTPIKVAVKNCSLMSEKNKPNSNSSRSEGGLISLMMGLPPLYVSVQRIQQPKGLLSSLISQKGCAALSLVRLQKGIGNQEEQMWISPVTSEALCVCSIQQKSSPKSQKINKDSSSSTRLGLGLGLGLDTNLGNNALSSVKTISGLCAVGCVDGSVHILTLGSGMRIAPPMVLGSPVTHVNMTTIIHTTTTGDKESIIRLMAISALGEMWVWDVIGGHLRCVIRDSVRPVITSMKCQTSQVSSSCNDNGNLSEITIDQAVLSEDGMPSLYLRSKGASGGDWQAFSYCPEGLVWTRLADLRHVMSRY